MVKLTNIKVAQGFEYDDSPQRSSRWFAIRSTRIGASEIGDYMAKGVKGQYLTGRKNVEKKIACGKAFGVPFERFVTGAMQAGIDNEDFVADQYSIAKGVVLEKVGCFYNDWLVASPDRLIVGQNGGIEIKWLFDTEWSEVAFRQEAKSGHYDQMQTQMLVTGWDFVDYVAANGNTGRFIVLRIMRDNDRIAEIEAEGESVMAIKPMVTANIFEFSTRLPVIEQSNEKVWED